MKEDEIEYFRTHLRRTLNFIFLDRKIASASEYFTIWQEIRKIVEEELAEVVQQDVNAELYKIKAL